MLNTYLHNAIEKAGLPPLSYEVSFIEHYAQSADDIIIAALLQAWISDKNNKKISDLTYLEIGANHPMFINSTYLLYRRYKMRGVLVEANPELIANLKKARPEDTVLNVAVTNSNKDEVTLIVPDSSEIASLVPEHIEACKNILSLEGTDNQRYIPVKAQRINDILSQHFSDAPPAYMSIDIEGHDLAVLQDMDFKKFQPLIIQIEHSNNLIPNHDRDICAFLQSKNYYLIAKTELNLIFVNSVFFSTLPSHISQRSNTLSTPQYFTKKYRKNHHNQPPVKTALNFIKSYLLFPWYTYKTYKKMNNIEKFLEE